MHPLIAVVLICASTVARSDCRADTAIDVLIPPEADSYSLCGLQSQAYIAGSALRVGDGRYMKIVCTRQQVTATLASPEE